MKRYIIVMTSNSNGFAPYICKNGNTYEYGREIACVYTFFEAVKIWLHLADVKIVRI